MEIKRAWEEEGIDRLEWLKRECKRFWESEAGKKTIKKARER